MYYPATMSLSFRIAHVSDLHLSPREPSRLKQAEKIAKSLTNTHPDFIVVTGDLTDDGWENQSDLAFAKDWLNKLNIPWRAVPGNHDVGNFANQPDGAITAERVERWVEVFQPTQVTHQQPQAGTWLEQLPGWCIIGLNTMLLGSGLLGSGLDLEAQQNAWLHETVIAAETRGDQILVFQHSPLMIDSIDETLAPSAGYWLGQTEARKALLEHMISPMLRLIGSGHVHQSRLEQTPVLSDCPMTAAWAPPASGTWVSSAGLPNAPAPEKTGYFMHTLSPDGLTTETILAAPILKAVEFTPWPG